MNKYKIKGKVAIITTQKGIEFLIDKEDLVDVLSKGTWFCIGGKYPRIGCAEPAEYGKKTISLKKMLLNTDKMVVNKNQNPFDCRKSNLTTDLACRPVTKRNRSLSQRNDYVIDDGTVYMPLTRKEGTTYFVEFDEADLDLVLGFRGRWHCMKANSGFMYVGANDGKGKHTLLHRLLTNTPDDMVVDHIDHNPLNNRRSNLRVCTHAENIRNKSPHKKSFTGYKNIYKEKSSCNYRVQIFYDGKVFYQGGITTLKKAIVIRNKALRKLHGEFANLN